MRPTYFTSTDQRCEQSQLELVIFERLRTAGVDLVPQVKLGQNWVFDGAINGTKILVEVHGDYWHNRPEVVERDARKQQWAEQEGYIILTIWETEFSAAPDRKLAEILATIAQLRRYMRTIDGSPEAAAAALDRSDTPPAIAARVYGDWRDRFLEVLAEGGIVREACIAARVSRQTAYTARADDELFAEDWRLALQDAADKALMHYRQRAVQQSDRAMEFFIKSRDPEPYSETARMEISGKNGGPIDVSTMSDDERVARAAAIFDRARARRAGSAAEEGAA